MIVSLVLRDSDQLRHHGEATEFHTFPDIFCLGSSPTPRSRDFPGVEYVCMGEVTVLTQKLCLEKKMRVPSENF